ncbi:MAG: adventurous gliding motility TPR repeat lipoprotein GltE [Deltaproteobacteria bacterium]|nr:adventurous gliding motility TPR repeat lipoprotein GltE [Deltaproteobacteria bacterium]
MSPPRSAALLLAALAGCASGGAAAPPATAARSASGTAVPLPPPPRAATAPAAGPSERGRRLFDEALAAAEEQKKLRIPTDWDLLAKRWRAAAEEGDLPESWFNLGVCLDRLGRRAEAAAAYRRALALQPAFGEAAGNLALTAEPDEPRAATAYWTDHLRRFPDDAVGRARLAQLAERAGRADEAWRLAREALQRDPTSTAALKAMVRVALARKNHDLAHLLALRAQKLEPGDPEIATAIGRILLAQGDEAAAAAQWQRAVELRPDYGPARAELLKLALSKQHWAGVAEQARALLKLDPGQARAELALGVAQRYLGEPQKAAASYDAAERSAGGRLPEVHLARGVLLARVEEKCEPALAELRRYAAAAGPAALADGGVARLERECVQMLAAGRAAEEEARRMKQEAARPGADTGAKKPTP